MQCFKVTVKCKLPRREIKEDEDEHYPKSFTVLEQLDAST